MSGPPVLTARRGTSSPLSIPRLTDPVNAAQVNSAFAVIEQYEAGRTARTAQQTPSFAGIQLVATDGSTWRLTVTPQGQVYVTAVPRT